MKPLVTNQWILTWFYVFPAGIAVKWSNILLSTTIFLIISLLSLICIALNVDYFLKFLKIDLEESLFALYQIAVGLMMANAIIVIFLSRHKLVNIFKSLDEIYKINRNNDSFKYLVSVNVQSEQMWRFLFKYLMSGTLMVTIMASVVSVGVCRVKLGYFDINCPSTAHKGVFPWDKQTLFGYLCLLFLNFLTAEAFWIAIGPLVLLFISINLHHRAFYKMFRNLLRGFDSTNKERNDTRRLILESVEFHKMVKTWFLDTAELYSPYFGVQLICSMLMLACLIFQINLEIKHIDSYIGILLMATLSTTFSLFLFCMCGKMSTESFSKMADRLFESNWQGLPIHLQKYFILMIEHAQKPLHYNGFGTVILNLETFTKMIKMILTYFMVLKAITTN